MKQLDLFFPEYVTVDGMKNSDGKIQYWGKAIHVGKGLYECVARVDGFGICRVEVNINFEAAL